MRVTNVLETTHDSYSLLATHDSRFTIHDRHSRALLLTSHSFPAGRGPPSRRRSEHDAPTTPLHGYTNAPSLSCCRLSASVGAVE